VADGDIPESVMIDVSINHEYEREITRQYPFLVTIRAYEISREDMDRAVDQFALYPTDTETGGVIGADGGIGWAPAINFEHEPDAYNETFGNAYVVPWPDTVRPITHDHDWGRVKRAVISTYR